MNRQTGPGVTVRVIVRPSLTSLTFRIAKGIATDEIQERENIESAAI